jgi:2',3'-cyclic-nucleotide 2'-phosphodiesterase (5'-nucleotidase family)
VELARSVPGIDLIVGGHSQNVVCMLDQYTRVEAYQPMAPCAPDRQQGTWIVQAGEWGKFVGRADFEYVGGELRLKRYTLLPVNMSPRGQDQAVIPEDVQAEVPPVCLCPWGEPRAASTVTAPTSAAAPPTWVD